MRFFRDLAWQFVAAFVTFIGVVVAIGIFLAGRPYKGLRVEVLSNSPVVSVNADLAGEIQVLYKGQSVQSLSLILLKIENTGNEPITESDYSEPIRISIAQNAQVGEVSIQETRPEKIPLTSTITSSDQIELSEVLLNPGDQAIVKVLALNNDGTLGIEGRIAGITQIEQVTGLQESNSAQVPLSQSNASVIVIALLSGGVLALIGSILFWESRGFNRWRSRHFNYDPAAAFYKSAQNRVLAGKATDAIHPLKIAFSWDRSYVDRSQKDSIFSMLQDYEPYIALISKYKLVESGSSNVANTPPTPS